MPRATSGRRSRIGYELAAANDFSLGYAGDELQRCAVSAPVLFWSSWTTMLAVAIATRVARAKARSGSKSASVFARASSLLGLLLVAAFALSVVYGLHLMHLND